MEKNCLEKFQDGEISLEEFQRLNVMEVLAVKYHEIMAPESYEYLKGLLESQAPTPEKALSDILQEVQDQREEILKAFLAEYGCKSDEAEPIPFVENGTCLTCGFKEEVHWLGDCKEFRPKIDPKS